MSALGDAIARRLGGEREELSFTSRVDDVVQEHGTVTAAARALGIDRRTLQRWRSGAIRAPKQSTQDKVNTQWRAATTPAVSGNVRIAGVEPGTGRPRDLNSDKLGLPDDISDRVRDKWIETGDKEAAAALLWNAIGVRDAYRDFLYDPEFDDSYEGDAIPNEDGHYTLASMAIAL